MRPILLATNDFSDVYTFWLYHKQCGVHNRVEVLSDGDDVARYLGGSHPNLPPPALLVASLKMPRMGGLQLLEHLKATRQNGFPSVLLIDLQDHDVTLAAAAFRLGAESFLMRPIQKKDFCDIMALASISLEPQV